MKVSELIYRAYVKSNVIANEGETLNSAQNSEALFELNTLIQVLNIDGAEISLITTESFNLIQDVSYLALTDYLEVKKVEYFLGDVKIDLPLLSMEDFYRVATLPSVNSIPVAIYPQRTESGVTLNVYYTPDSAYALSVHGLKRITQDLSVDDTISGTNEFYLPLLYYELASALRVNNDLPESQGLNKKISQIKSRLRLIKGHDVSLNLPTALDWRTPQQKAMSDVARATILHGWTP